MLLVLLRRDTAAVRVDPCRRVEAYLVLPRGLLLLLSRVVPLPLLCCETDKEGLADTL